MSKLILCEDFQFFSNPETEEEKFWEQRFYDAVDSETVRGAVLNITSFIDELLIKVLGSYFPNHSHAYKLLNSMDGCMSSIMDRANVAFSLSLLREREFHAIKIIARIRNEFAHKWDNSDFESEPVTKLIRKFPSYYFDLLDGTNRAKFNFVSSQIIQRLLKRHVHSAQLNALLPKEYTDIDDLPLENDVKKHQFNYCQTHRKVIKTQLKQ